MTQDFGRYLRPGPDQDRVVGMMASGHGYSGHGRELKDTPAQYAARTRAHLREAPITVAVADPKGRPRLLVADLRTDQVAWVTPHREHRSTLFQPRRGAEHYLGVQRAQSPPGRWHPLTPGRCGGRARRGSSRPTATARTGAMSDGRGPHA